MQENALTQTVVFSRRTLKKEKRSGFYIINPQNIILLKENILTIRFVFCIINIKLCDAADFDLFEIFDVRKRLKQAWFVWGAFFLYEC